MFKQGQEIEDAMKLWFRGHKHPSDCVDFQTSTTLYEVKSCQLFNHNNNYKSHKNQPFCYTRQLGRFHIINYNHKLLYETSQEEKKKAKYIFIVLIDRQKFWKVLNWQAVDYILPILQKEKSISLLRIGDIFSDF